MRDGAGVGVAVRPRLRDARRRQGAGPGRRCAHRLSLRPEAELEGVDVGAVLASRPRLRPGPALTPMRPDGDHRTRPAAAPAGAGGGRAAPGGRRRCGCGCCVVAAAGRRSTCARWPVARARSRVERRRRSTGSGPGTSPPARWSSATRARRTRACWSATPGSRPPARDGNRHRLRLAAGDQRAADHVAAPDPARRAPRAGVTRAQPRPARARGPAGAPATCRRGPGRCRRSSPASTCRPGSPGCATSTGGRRCGCAARAPSSTRCASTSRGDDVRSIDWRATARNRDVVVRTWQPERDRRVRARARHLARRRPAGSATCRASTPRWRPPCCSTALAARAGDRVDVVAGDRRVRDAAAGWPAPATPPADSRTRCAGLAARDRRGGLDRARGRRRSRWAGSARWSCLLTPARAVGGRGGAAARARRSWSRTTGSSWPRSATPSWSGWPRRATALDEVYAAAAAEQTLARRRRTADLLRRARRRRGRRTGARSCRPPWPTTTSR